MSLDMKLSKKWILRFWSSHMWHHIVLYIGTTDLEEPEAGGSKFLWYVGSYLPNYVVLHTRWLQSKCDVHTWTLLWISLSRWCRTCTEPSHWLIKSWRSPWACLNIFAVRSNTRSKDSTSPIIWLRSWFFLSTSAHKCTRANSSSCKTNIKSHISYLIVQMYVMSLSALLYSTLFFISS